MSLQVSQLLNELEDVLRTEKYWRDLSPTAEALSSVEPFCIDTLSCTEWLQWVYIPRLRAIIEQRSDLPVGAQVYPYIGEALAGLDVTGILDVIARLDEAMAQ